MAAHRAPQRQGRGKWQPTGMGDSARREQRDEHGQRGPWAAERQAVLIGGHALSRPAGSSASSTPTRQSASQRFLRAQRGRPRLLQRKERVKTRRRRTREARYERGVKTHIPPTGEPKKQFKDPRHPGPPWPFSCFVLSVAQSSDESTPACPVVMLPRGRERRGTARPQTTRSL